MAVENSVFLCRVCKPIVEEPRTKATTNVDGLKCNMCEFKTKFRFNLTRHVETRNTGQDESAHVIENEHTDEHVTGTPATSNDVSTISIETILKEIGLKNLLKNFISEGVDFDMLVKLNDSNLKECFKEIGINRFGDRHRIVERIGVEKIVNIYLKK